MLRQRHPQPAAAPGPHIRNGDEQPSFISSSTSSSRPSTSSVKTPKPVSVSEADYAAPSLGDDEKMANGSAQPEAWSRRNSWMIFAIASGACAAFNGVFAKLTTTELTTTFAQGIAKLFGLSAVANVVELVVRCGFFGLNLAFNGVMWTLFTTALARGHSTTQVSIMNTSSNFVITALLGVAIFSEALPPLWWLGATFLVAGSVITGKKDESTSEEAEDDAASEAESGEGGYAPVYHDESDAPGEDVEKEDEDIPDLGNMDDTIPLTGRRANSPRHVS